MRLTHFLAATLLLLTVACKAPQGVIFKRVDNLAIQKISGSQVELQAKVWVFNPNKFDVKVWSVEGECLVNERNTGMLSLDTATSLPANQEWGVPVKASINTASLLGSGLQLLLGGEIPYSFKGTAKAGRGKWKWNIPISQSGTFTRKQLEALLY